MIQVTNDRGRKFNVRIVLKGDRYGRGDCLVHDKTDPMVEFYDATYENKPGFGHRGQFVSRYYLSTINNEDGFNNRIGKTEITGIWLECSEPAWQVTKQNVLDAIYYAEGIVAHLSDVVAHRRT